MEKHDLTAHSDTELSLYVFNDEYLYKMRKNLKNLIIELNEFYIYSDEQLDVLKQDIEDDALEDS